MASNACSISDGKEPYETLNVQIKFVGISKQTTSGNVLRHGGREFQASRFGTWMFHENDKQEDVREILIGGGVVVALVWGIMKMYPELTVWVTDVNGYRFALDMKKCNKASILDEIGKGKMAEKIERVLKNLTVTDAYKNIKVKLVKILRDQISTKEKKTEDSTNPIPEVVRLKKLEEAEKIESLMHNQNFSWAFMRLRTLLQSETDNTVRLQLLIRLAICSLHVENEEELESSTIQMLKLMKTVVVPDEEFPAYEKEYILLLFTLQANGLFIRSIEITLAWTEVLKQIADARKRADMTNEALCLACDSINKLLSIKPGTFLKSQILQYIKQIEKGIAYMKNMKDCDSLAMARNVYYVEFVLSTTKWKLDLRPLHTFGKETKIFNGISSCWADFAFVCVCLSQDSKTKSFMTQEDFRNIAREISENPELLKEKLSDPRIALANEVLLSRSAGICDIDADSERKQVEELLKSGMFGSAAGKPEPKKPETVNKVQEAQKEKEKGNAAYKKTEFEKAIRHYEKAISLDPTNGLLHSNKAAVYIEQKKLDLARASCLTAINLAQNNDRHTEKDIAKIMARLARTEMLDNMHGRAVQLYERSLHLHYDPKVKEQLDECKNALRFSQFMAHSMRQSPFFPFF